nr:cupin domain-containing protein [Pseudomonadota bacterium]
VVATAQSDSGRGIIPQVSDHYKTLPSFYDFNQMPVEQISRGIQRRFIMGTQSSMIRWDLKAGVVLPVHFHVNEQVTRVEKGELMIYSQGQEYNVKAGQVMIFPPNVPHEFVALKDAVVIEVHAPARQDFINGEFDKMMNNH